MNRDEHLELGRFFAPHLLLIGVERQALSLKSELEAARQQGAARAFEKAVQVATGWPVLRASWLRSMQERL